MYDKIFGLQRNVFFLGVTSFFNDLSVEMMQSVMPAFFISVLKSGAGALGLVEGIADAAANFIKIYSGRLSDKLERRKIFAIVGYTLSVATRPFYILVGSVPVVAGLRLVDRVGKGLRDAPRDALISLSTAPEEVGRSFGYHRAMDTAGAILGPLAAYLILRAYPGAFSAVFVTAFFVGLLAIMSLVFVKEIRQVVHSNGVSPLSSFSKSFQLYAISIFVMSLGTLPVAILLFKTQSLGFAIATIPLFYMVCNISFASFSWPSGQASDQFGSGRVIFLGYVFLILAYAVLNSSAGGLALGAGFVALGIFSALTDGVQRSHVSHLVPQEHRGIAYGFLNAAQGFGALIAGALGGYLWQYQSEAFALFGAMLMVVLGLVLFFWSLRFAPNGHHAV